MVLFGPGGDGEPTAEDWAAVCGTIGYEIVTRIGARVPRRYLEPPRVAEASDELGRPGPPARHPVACSAQARAGPGWSPARLALAAAASAAGLELERRIVSKRLNAERAVDDEPFFSLRSTVRGAHPGWRTAAHRGRRADPDTAAVARRAERR